MALILNDDFFITSIVLLIGWGIGIWFTPKASRWSKVTIAGTLLLVGGVFIYGLVNWTTLFWNEYRITNLPESISYPQRWSLRVSSDSEVSIWHENAEVHIKKLNDPALNRTSQEQVLTELVQEIQSQLFVNIFEDSISEIGTITYGNCLAMTQSFDAGVNRVPFIKGKAYAIQCDSGLYTVWTVSLSDYRYIATLIAETNIANLR